VGSQYASCLATVVDQTSSAVYTITSSAYGLSYVATNFGFTQLFSPVAIGVSSSSYVFPGNGSVLPWGISNLTGYAANGNLTSFYEPYSQATGLQFGGNSVYMDKICVRTMSQSGSPGSETVIAGSLGIGSKAFSVNGQICLIGAFQSQLQNSYFLINTNGAVLSRIAYGNGGGYYPLGAPSVSVIGSTASFAYLFKDFVQSRSTANLTLSSASLSGQSGNIYTQTGINFGEFTFSGSNQSAKELGGVLNLNGGFLWTFDSLQATENNFFLYPEGGAYSAYGAVSSAISQMTSGQQYNYVGVYEWTDNQANIHQSAPSLAVSLPALTTSSSVGVQVTMPVLRTTNRVSSNPVALALYRSSTQQPTFYRMGSVNLNGQIQTASITSYLSVFVNGSNNLDTVSFFDTSSDSFILGNKILYTTGGVLEDSAGPPAIAMAIWDSRLWLISAEDGTLWYSKIVIPSTPVEMSQFQTIYVPNAQGAQGSSGLPKCLFAMNDKLIIFKKNMLFFINGTGPDATGANSQYSDPIQIPSGVGCENQASVVLTPVGLMFQSDNGIWLLGQDLSLRYVGKDVEDYNSSKVLAATCVPGTSEVRFEMDNGIKLVYDYLVDQWATFSISGQSSVIYGNKHTFLNGAQVYQETPNVYSDGAVPVTLSFQTGWFNLSGLQGYQRAYFMELLGNFYSPHTFQTNIAYNYNSAIAQSVSVNPSNVVGSGSSVEQWEIGFQQQQCQSFQISFQETASASAGAGLTLSGIGLTYGRKKTWPRNIPIPNRTG